MNENRVGWIVLVLVILAILGAHAQAQVGGSSVQPAYGPTYQVADHPQHASQHDLRPEQSLLGGGGVTVAQGERPMSDFPTYKRETPLGDVARAYREEHAKAEKALIHWNQQ
jgi:hypothetical protein